MSGTLINPRHTAAYDAKEDRFILAFRDGRDASVVELGDDELKALIHALNEARRDAKAARRPVPIPPPMVRPATCPAPTLAVVPPDVPRADRKPIRLVGGARR